MGFVAKNGSVCYGFLVLSMFVATVSLSQNIDSSDSRQVSSEVDHTETDGGIRPQTDGGAPSADDTDSARSEPATEPHPSQIIRDDERPNSARESAEQEVDWRHDSTLRRRPGSYLGGVLGYAMGRAWYTTTQQDLVSHFEIGPLHLMATSVRVGDAFFDWLSVGFQVTLIPAGGSQKRADQVLRGFGLYLDTTFYPWRGLGLRPSVGLGFSFAQDGTEAFQLGFGGPASLAFTLSYEFRVTRLLTMGPAVQVSWISGEDYDALFLFIGLEILKWFKTAKG